MLVDINEAKSRGYNILLRYLQFALQLFIGLKLSLMGIQNCSTSFTKLSQPISYTLMVLNFFGIIYVRCRQNFARIQFFIIYAINLVLSAVVAIMGLASSGESNTCASNKVSSKFSFIGTITIIISVMILFLPFGWIQRYSNSPGNLVWPLLFFSFPKEDFKTMMIVIGCITFVISLISFFVHLAAAYKGTTTTLKKIIIVGWVGCIVLMVACEILAIVAYLGNSQSQSYLNNISKKIIQVFCGVNLLDIVFWIWGLLTLNYQNGDPIRDTLLNFNNNPNKAQDNFDDVIKQNNIGTVK